MKSTELHSTDFLLHPALMLVLYFILTLSMPPFGMGLAPWLPGIKAKKLFLFLFILALLCCLETQI